MDEVKNLFELASEQIFKDLNMENVPILSEIAKVKQDYGENYDFHTVENVLALINGYFRNHDDNIERSLIFESFAARLMVENVEQIENKYNFVIENIRSYFPDFNLVHRDHNPFFGEDAVLKCHHRNCTDEEYEKAFMSHEPFVKHFDPKILQKDLKLNRKEVEKNKNKSAFIKNCSGYRTLNCLSDGPKSMLSSTSYTNNGYIPINNFLRAIKTSDYSLESMTEQVSRFFPYVVMPFYSSTGFSIYRGDTQKLSSEKFTTKGFYSGGLSLQDMRGFVKNGGRLLKININSDTPFIPLIINRIDEGEIVLMPNTELTKVTELEFENKGHFVEYNVSNNPPKLSDYEEANIFRFIIPDLLKKRTYDWKSRHKYYKNKEQAQDFIDCIPKMENGPTEKERIEFYVELSNRIYGTDW